MKAWQIAAGEKSRTLARHTGDSSEPDDDPRWLDMLKRKYKRWEALKMPGRNYRCFVCEKQTGKGNTSGYLPGFGGVVKCADCREEFEEIVASLKILGR